MAEVTRTGDYLGLQVVVKGTLANPSTTALLASDIVDEKGVKSYTHFYIKLDSAAAGATTGTIKIKNTHSETLTLNFNVQDEWYPEMIQEIVGDLGTARGIVYGVAY